jgi:predicted ATPase
MLWQGCLSALAGNPSDSIETLGTALAHIGQREQQFIYRLFCHTWARAYRDLGHHNQAWEVIKEAMTATVATKESWCEPEIDRIMGELVLVMSPLPDAAKAEAYFDRALAVARNQQAKSWELRAAMSMARLWRDQGKRDDARDLLAPVYGWFTEGFDTLDLKEAKKLLDELSS